MFLFTASRPVLGLTNAPIQAVPFWGVYLKWLSKGKSKAILLTCRGGMEKMWEPRRLTTLWASTACYRDKFTFYLLYIIYLYPKRKKWG
jgi:hypothetical protein